MTFVVVTVVALALAFLGVLYLLAGRWFRDRRDERTNRLEVAQLGRTELTDVLRAAALEREEERKQRAALAEVLERLTVAQEALTGVVREVSLAQLEQARHNDELITAVMMLRQQIDTKASTLLHEIRLNGCRSEYSAGGR